MSIDHIVLAVIGVVGVIFGLYLLSEAKAYRARHYGDKDKGAI
jgi:hypothetical protein